MNLRSFFLVLTLAIISGHLFANENTQKHTDKLSTLNTQSQWIFEIAPLNSLLETPVDLVQNYEKIYVKNSCYSDIVLAAHYLDLSSDWISNGPWRLVPGEKGYLFNTRNLIMYYYAETEEGHRWAGDYNIAVNGYNLPMKKYTMNFTSWGAFTLELTCN